MITLREKSHANGYMKLLEVHFSRFRQFIDQRLEVDSRVTAIVGRNDTGKTGVIGHFFHQRVYENVVPGGDRPRVRNSENSPTHYSLTWAIDRQDYARFKFPEEFGQPAQHRLVTSFQESAPNGKHWTYLLDGRELEPYEGTSKAGTAIRKKGFEWRHVLPVPRYINPQRLLQPSFEMRLFDYPDDPGEFIRRTLSPEARLLRLGGIKVETRKLVGLEQPWTRRIVGNYTLPREQIEQGLRDLSACVTEQLKIWWQDPPDLRFEARLAGGNFNPAAVICNILDAEATTYWGTGLWWFVTFLVEVMFVQQTGPASLLLLDEPATPLHPSAQRMVAKFLAALSRSYQVIYASHSPFMLDWNFPQRIRLFLRDHSSKPTSIVNKPYGPRERTHDVWDPLRENIGVTLGDIGILNKQNVLVEGISDQILLANASAALESKGRPSLDLNQVSLIPHNDSRTLKRLISMIKSRGFKAVVLADEDEQGKTTQRICQREQVPWIGIGQFCDRTSGDKSIEDLLGVGGYLAATNAFYDVFQWFSPIDASFGGT
jgi:predicted ATPase